MTLRKIGEAVYVDTEEGWRSGQICDYQQTSIGLLYVIMLMDGEVCWTRTVDKRETMRSLGER